MPNRLYELDLDELVALLAKAIGGYHWIAEKNMFVDTGSKNKATVMLSILEPKQDKD